MPTERLNEIPSSVLAMIEVHSGRVLGAHTVTGGLNSAIAARVRTEAETLFVKGLPADHPAAPLGADSVGRFERTSNYHVRTNRAAPHLE
jgi:hypothetical protein